MEGYADVISMHQAGIENVVASSGTSLTTEQIKMVKRYTQNVTLLYDGDSAGIHAALRGTNMILEEGMNVRFIVLPPDEDPDSFVRNNSIEVVTDYLKNNAKDFIGFKTNLLLKEANNDPIKKAAVIKDIVETISVIPDPIYRATYIKECSTMLQIPEQTLMNELNKMLRAKYRKSLGVKDEQFPDNNIVSPPQPVEPEQIKDSSFYQEQELVKILLAHGNESIEIEDTDDDGNPVIYSTSVASLIIDDLKNDGLCFNDKIHKRVFDIFDQALDTEQIPDASFFVSNEDNDIASMAASLLCSQYRLDNWERHKIFVKTEDDVLKKMVLSSLLRFKDKVIAERLSQVMKELKEATDPDVQITLIQKKKKLDDIRKIINQRLGIVIA